MYQFKEPKEAYEITRKFAKDGNSSGVIEFPPYITFELLNVCNFRCIMCPNSYMKRQRKEMDFELFKKLIDEIAPYGSLIRFIGYEEPLLYSRIKDAIKYVKSKGLLLHITTNGSLLNEEVVKTIIRNKVDSVIFSFQGLTKEEYCFMRNLSPEMHSKVIANIKSLYKKRKNGKPYIKITTTTTDRDLIASKDSFIKDHLKFADEVQVTGFTHFIHITQGFDKENMWRKLGIRKPQKLEGARCFVPNYEMLIKEDENIYACCGDYSNSLKIGAAGKKSLFDIWHSKKAEMLRKTINNGDLDKFKNCAVCPIRYKYKNIDSTVINSRQGRVEKFVK